MLYNRNILQIVATFGLMDFWVRRVNVTIS